MCFVLADAAVFCGAECSEEPLWWGGDASRVRRGYTDVPAKESAPTWYFSPKAFQLDTHFDLSCAKKVDAGECDKGRLRQKCLKLITIGTSSM